MSAIQSRINQWFVKVEVLAVAVSSTRSTAVFSEDGLIFHFGCDRVTLAKCSFCSPVITTSSRLLVAYFSGVG